MKMVLIPCINNVYSCGIQIQEFFRRQWIKTDYTLRYKKNCQRDSSKMPEIKPYITSVSLRTFIGRVSKKVDLEIKNTEKGVKWNPLKIAWGNNEYEHQSMENFKQLKFNTESIGITETEPSQI